MPYGVWFHKRQREIIAASAAADSKKKAKQEEDAEVSDIEDEESKKLNPEDYNIYMNPKILAETEVISNQSHYS